MTVPRKENPRTAGSRGRTATATRILAHRLFQRACRRGTAPDLETALRLLDERLVPGAEDRRAAAEAALALSLGAFGEHRPGGRLEGELRANVRVGIRRRDGSSRVVRIPSLLLGKEGSAAAVWSVQDADAETARRRARRYRHAARVLLGRPVRAFVVRVSGALDELPPGR